MLPKLFLFLSPSFFSLLISISSLIAILTRVTLVFLFFDFTLYIDRISIAIAVNIEYFHDYKNMQKSFYFARSYILEIKINSICVIMSISEVRIVSLPSFCVRAELINQSSTKYGLKYFTFVIVPRKKEIFWFKLIFSQKKKEKIDN